MNIRTTKKTRPSILHACRGQAFSFRRRKECVAVIIPVYNVTLFLEEAIRSAANQNYPYKEIIVVDDGSCEESAAEIERICGLFPGIMLLRQEHIGPAAARSKGVACTSAALVVFLDADDILLLGALSYFATSLRKNPDAVAAYAKVHYIDEHGNYKNARLVPEYYGKDVLYKLLERELCFCNGSICIRKKALEGLSPNNHTMKYGEDWVLWCHLALSGNIIYAGGKAVLANRLHMQRASATFLDNFNSLIAAHDTVFTDPKFISAIGEAELHELRRKCMSRIHMRIASLYSELLQPEKAAQYLAQVDLLPSSLSENGKN